MISKARYTAALKAAVTHLLASSLVAALAAVLVFGFWYPYPFRELSGGRELFILIMAVDVVCGPLLTAVLFSPSKPRGELWRDLTIVALLQLGALAYGLHTVSTARPLFLVSETDRFKVIAAADLQDDDASKELMALPAELKPHFFQGPVTIAIRDPKDAQERQTVLFESVQGGRDYAERPDFYQSYSGDAALKSLVRAKPLSVFLEKQPNQKAAAAELAAKKGVEIQQWVYLPVVARQDWVAVLDKRGQIQGFLKGDGF